MGLRENNQSGRIILAFEEERQMEAFKRLTMRPMDSPYNGAPYELLARPHTPLPAPLAECPAYLKAATTAEIIKAMDFDSIVQSVAAGVPEALHEGIEYLPDEDTAAVQQRLREALDDLADENPRGQPSGNDASMCTFVDEVDQLPERSEIEQEQEHQIQEEEDAKMMPPATANLDLTDDHDLRTNGTQRAIGGFSLFTADLDTIEEARVTINSSRSRSTTWSPSCGYTWSSTRKTTTTACTSRRQRTSHTWCAGWTTRTATATTATCPPPTLRGRLVVSSNTV